MDSAPVILQLLNSATNLVQPLAAKWPLSGPLLYRRPPRVHLAAKGCPRFVMESNNYRTTGDESVTYFSLARSTPIMYQCFTMMARLNIRIIIRISRTNQYRIDLLKVHKSLRSSMNHDLQILNIRKSCTGAGKSCSVATLAQTHRHRQNIGPTSTSPHQNSDCAKTSMLSKHW